MTFSVLGRDEHTGDLGCAVQSKFLAVGAIVPCLEAGVGAVATQALANVSFGPRVLRLLGDGASPAEAIARLSAEDPTFDRRQLGIVDATGRSAAHTGSGCIPAASHTSGAGYSCQGNSLATPDAVAEMARAWQTSAGSPLAERLVACLEAAQSAGGDKRGQQSAALLVVRRNGGYGGTTDRMIDLRVDDHPQPIRELERLLQLHHLYSDPPGSEDLLFLEGKVASQAAEAIGSILGMTAPSPGPELWRLIDRWAGTQNLEEKMTRPGMIDRTVLRMLRQHGARVRRGQLGDHAGRRDRERKGQPNAGQQRQD